MTHSEEDTTTMSSKMAEGAPVSPSGSSDANHNLNKPLLTSSSSSSSSSTTSSSGTLAHKTIREDVVASDFLSVRRSSPTLLLPPLRITARTVEQRPEDDVEDGQVAAATATDMEEVEEDDDAMDEEDDEEDQTLSRETRLTDNDKMMNKYLTHV